ncbi:unnamed protein product [Allacma fusca]|uniref:Uncharacterized protein n=1 Tax=Allacma fusca TaxID=39272 RepID=A0A8J2J7Q5_9HEXA|nr:unnamed protein product [Allacma fusca]
MIKMPKEKAGQDLYLKLKSVWRKYRQTKPVVEADKEMHAWWNVNKFDPRAVIIKLDELNLKNQSRPKPILVGFAPESISDSEKETNNDTVDTEYTRTFQYETPAQNRVKKTIGDLYNNIDLLQKLKNTPKGISEEQRYELKSMKAKLVLQKNKLKRLKRNQRSSQKLRKNQRAALQQLRKKHPECTEEFDRITAATPKPGRPAIEQKQPGLLKAILDIVSANAMADERRRCETLRTGFTLSEVLGELKNMAEYVYPKASDIEDCYEFLIPERGGSDDEFSCTDAPCELPTTVKKYPKHLFEFEDINISQNWIADHVQQTQYLLQTALKHHAAVHDPNETGDTRENVCGFNDVTVSSEEMPIINNIEAWLQPVFIDANDLDIAEEIEVE